MISLKGLTTKRIIDLNPFTQIRDLFQSTIKLIGDNDDIPLEYEAIHRVEAWEVGRPDKISYKYFTTPDYVDAICKYNGVSNPFSLEEGRLLRIPTKQVIDRSYRKLIFKNKKSDISEKLKRFADATKKGSPDSAKKGFNQSKKRAAPPNVLRSGETGIRKDLSKNKITLGQI